MTKKKNNDELAGELEKLATQIAKDLLMDGVSSLDRLAGMKVLTGYFAATRKLTMKKPDGEDEEPAAFSFAGLGDKLRAVK